MTRLTNLTFVGSLSRVSPRVTVELARVLEGTVADGTLVGPFFGVDAAVHVQVLLHTECLVTELASGEEKCQKL